MNTKNCEYCKRWFDPSQHIDCPVCGPSRRHDELVSVLRELIEALKEDRKARSKK